MEIYYHNVTGIHYVVIGFQPYIRRGMFFTRSRVNYQTIERNEFGFFEKVA